MTANDEEPDLSAKLDAYIDATEPDQSEQQVPSKQTPSISEGIGYYCKICGKKVETDATPSRCLHCGIPICSKCRSCGFCLNCFVRLNTDTGKMLKLLRQLIWTAPFFSIFSLMYGIGNYFLTLAVLLGTLTLLYYGMRRKIISQPDRYFPLNWRKIVQAESYQQYQDPNLSKRFISAAMVDHYDQSIEDRKKKLQKWIEPNTDFSNVPVPDVPESLEVEERIPGVDEFLNLKIDYALIGQPCPKCKETIIFADFCPACNIKFFPECGEQNDPYVIKCLCGLIFPLLENEYLLLLKKNKEFEKND